MLARLPKPVLVAMIVIAALAAPSIILPALLGSGNGPGFGFWFLLGLLALGIFVLRRTTVGRTRQLFDAFKNAVLSLQSTARYLGGCRWPKALIWFLLSFGIIFVLTIPLVSMFLWLVAMPYWLIFTVNLGFAQLIAEAAMRKVSPAWALVGLSWFAGYAAVSIHGHLALDRLSAEIAAENSRQSPPFDPGTQSLVVVKSNIYGAPSAESLLRTYPLSVVYEENEDAGDATKPVSDRNRPRFTALRLGPPELCDSITDNARLKAAVTDHIKTTISGTPFCRTTAIEAPELAVVRLRFEQEKLRIIGAEGQIDRTTLTSGGDKRQVASLRAAPYHYLPLPFYGCFLGDGRWVCQFEFLKESQRPHPDNIALIGKSLGLEPSSAASRSEQIYAAGPAALKRTQNLAEAAAAAEFDRLLANPTGSMAPFNLNVLSARPDLISNRAERLAAAAAEAFTTPGNGLNVSMWSALMIALADADFRRVGPSFVGAVLARWTNAAGLHNSYLGERLIYRLADLGPTALPLLERIYQKNGSSDRLASIVALCRIGAPAARLTEKIHVSIFSESNQDSYRFEMREATILALMRQGRDDLADAGRRQYEQWAAAELRNSTVAVRDSIEQFKATMQIMTPSSSPDACMITKN